MARDTDLPRAFLAFVATAAVYVAPRPPCPVDVRASERAQWQWEEEGEVLQAARGSGEDGRWVSCN